MAQIRKENCHYDNISFKNNVFKLIFFYPRVLTQSPKISSSLNVSHLPFKIRVIKIRVIKIRVIKIRVIKIRIIEEYESKFSPPTRREIKFLFLSNQSISDCIYHFG